LGDYSLQCALIHVVAYIGGFRISKGSCAGCLQSGLGAAAAGHAVRHTTYKYHGAIFIPPWRRRPIRKRANWWNVWYFNTKSQKCRTFNSTIRLTM